MQLDLFFGPSYVYVCFSLRMAGVAVPHDCCLACVVLYDDAYSCMLAMPLIWHALLY